MYLSSKENISSWSSIFSPLYQFFHAHLSSISLLYTNYHPRDLHIKIFYTPTAPPPAPPLSHSRPTTSSPQGPFLLPPHATPFSLAGTPKLLPPPRAPPASSSAASSSAGSVAPPPSLPRRIQAEARVEPWRRRRACASPLSLPYVGGGPAWALSASPAAAAGLSELPLPLLRHGILLSSLPTAGARHDGGRAALELRPWRAPWLKLKLPHRRAPPPASLAPLSLRRRAPPPRHPPLLPRPWHAAPSAPFSRHPRRAPSLLLSVSAEARTVPIPRAAKAMARQRPAGCSAPPAGSARGGGHGRARARICAPLAELRGGLERGSFARGGLAAANGVATAMGMVDGGSSFRSEPRREGGVVGTPRRYRVVRTTRGVADGGRNGNIAYHLQSLVPCCSHFYGKSVLQYWEADGFQYPLRPALALSPSLDPRNCPNNVAR